MRSRQLITSALAFGAIGWLIENLYAGPRYSRILGGAKTGVPFLPVYAAGGLLLTAMAPRLKKRNAVERAAAYSAAFTGLELLACKLDALHTNGNSWDYGDGACVDLPHSIAWGVMGLLAEPLAAPRLKSR